MYRVGIYNELVVIRDSPHGVYLGSELDIPSEQQVLLPNNQVPEGCALEDVIRVFVYTDSEDRPVATCKTPHGVVGDFTGLHCVDTTSSGAFFDWGLDKDLFVPHALQHDRIVTGSTHVVFIDLDERSNRVLGTTRLSKLFDYDLQALRGGQEVSLLVYSFNEFGAQVIVDSRYPGIVYRNATFEALRVGQRLQGYVGQIRDDNKVDVTLQRQGALGLDDSASAILEKLESVGGFLPLHDKSSPEEIGKLLKMSKKSFKRGIGSLYKARKIIINDDGVQLIASGNAPKAGR